MNARPIKEPEASGRPRYAVAVSPIWVAPRSQRRNAWPSTLTPADRTTSAISHLVRDRREKKLRIARAWPALEEGEITETGLRSSDQIDGAYTSVVAFVSRAKTATPSAGRYRVITRERRVDADDF